MTSYPAGHSIGRRVASEVTSHTVSGHISSEVAIRVTSHGTRRRRYWSIERTGKSRSDPGFGRPWRQLEADLQPLPQALGRPVPHDFRVVLRTASRTRCRLSQASCKGARTSTGLILTHCVYLLKAVSGGLPQLRWQSLRYWMMSRLPTSIGLLPMLFQPIISLDNDR